MEATLDLKNQLNKRLLKFSEILYDKAALQTNQQKNSFDLAVTIMYNAQRVAYSLTITGINLKIANL